MKINRREFTKKLGATALFSPMLTCPTQLLSETNQNKSLEIHLFSKHLQFLPIKEASDVAKSIGFSGLDLTVRPKGHILPQNVFSQLPQAIVTIKKAGLKCDLITTAINSTTNDYDTTIIEVAAANGVKYYRCDWFKYLKDKSLQESISFYQDEIKALSIFNEKNNIIGCYQNHAGLKIGASYWEIEQLLKTANRDYFGTQYDIRHAVAEAGKSWPNGLKLLKNSIKTIVLKDFKWGKINGKWNIVNVPIGEGMVDFKSYFSFLKSNGLNPPTSLHLEYDLGGAEKGKSKLTAPNDFVYNAMKKDLTTLQKLWLEA